MTNKEIVDVIEAMEKQGLTVVEVKQETGFGSVGIAQNNGRGGIGTIAITMFPTPNPVHTSQRLEKKSLPRLAQVIDDMGYELRRIEKIDYERIEILIV
jgi:hypothetical protein